MHMEVTHCFSPVSAKPGCNNVWLMTSSVDGRSWPIFFASLQQKEISDIQLSARIPEYLDRQSRPSQLISAANGCNAKPRSQNREAVLISGTAPAGALDITGSGAGYL